MRARFVLFLLFAFLCFSASAQAETVPSLLESIGLTEQAVDTFEGYLPGLDESVTEADVRGVLEAIAAQPDGEEGQGVVSESTYIDPQGFSMVIPEGWTMSPESGGTLITLIGPQEEVPVTPSITVLVVDVSGETMMDKTREEVEAILSASLPNFQFIAMDDFEMLDGDARELVVMYGTREDAMLMQYQTHFVRENKAFTVTLTTLAEEAVHDSALDTYDAFLAAFAVQDGAGNG